MIFIHCLNLYKLCCNGSFILSFKNNYNYKNIKFSNFSNEKNEFFFLLCTEFISSLLKNNHDTSSIFQLKEENILNLYWLTKS